MIFNAKQCHQPSFSSTYAMKMCQQMLFFSMIKNLSKPVDLNQFFFFCRVCPKCKRIATLIFIFMCRLRRWLRNGWKKQRSTLSDSGHTIDPNTHNLSISINHHIPCNNNDLSTFVHEIKMKINYAFLKRIIECPWIENWAENQFLCLMQKRKMHLLRKLHLDVFHERKLHLYFSRYSRYLLLLPLGFNRLKSEKINMASLQCLYLLVACSLDKIVYVKKPLFRRK